MLHAIEKPMNLDYVQPFSNTTDLVNLTPHIDPNLAMEKEKEREYRRKKGLEATEDGKAEKEEIVLEETKDDTFQVKGSSKSKSEEGKEK